MWMKLDQNNENTGEKLKQGNLLRCPMCKGRGYFEPTEAAKVSNLKGSNEFLSECENDHSVKLPQLVKTSNRKQWQKPRNKYSLPSINNIKNLPEHRSTEWCDTKVHGDFQETKELCEKQDGLSEIENSIFKKNDTIIRSETTHRLSMVSSTDSNTDVNLIPSPKTPKNPTETLKISLSKLKTANWNEALSALKEIVQLSRFQPQTVEPSMPLVYRGIIFFLKSFRSVVVRTACQASNELFATMANTQRPEFDEVVGVLLQKTADTNKSVRQDANEALDTMIINISPINSVRAIAQKGISHKSPMIRSTSARLLVCVVGVVGVDAIFSGNKETRARIINAGASFMQDGNQEVRSFGKRLMKMLMKHDDFDDVLQAEVNEVILKRIEKTLITTKYKS